MDQYFLYNVLCNIYIYIFDELIKIWIYSFYFLNNINNELFQTKQ